MENIKVTTEQTMQAPENLEKQKLIENFYTKYFKTQTEGVRKISIDNLKELKEAGISAEQFLDYLCQNRGFLLHGSIHEIQGNKLRSGYKKIFAANKSAIAIMRSIYSNIDVSLGYSYFIHEDSPLELEIHTPNSGKFIAANKGFIYVVDATGFRNDPEGSWQFVKEDEEVSFRAVVETEKDDFQYPVKVSSNFERD